MSMREYSVDDYGLVINTNILNLLAKQIFPDEYTDEKWEDLDFRYDIAYDICEHFDFGYIGEFTGECYKIDIDGRNIYDSEVEYYSSDSIYYVQLDKYPTLFKKAYNGINDVAKELSKKLGDYLPDDFRYGDFVRHIVGTYWG